MSRFASSRHMIWMVVFTLLLGMSSSYAAKKKSRKKMIIKEVMYTQKKGTTKSVVKNTSNRQRKTLLGKNFQWGRVDVNYESYVPWSDDIQVKLFVLFYDKKAKKEKKRTIKSPFTMFFGEVTYLDVPQSKNNSAEFFIHPHSYARYGQLIMVRSELWHKGVMVSEKVKSFAPKSIEKNPGLRNWWSRLAPLKDRIFNRYQTPFVHDSDNSPCPIKL